MGWAEVLASEIEMTYAATFGLLDLVDEDALDWRPQTENNWMTMAVLLQHITTSCGWCCRGFVTGDWNPPAGQQMTGDEALPPADRMIPATAVAATRAELAADKDVALAMIREVGEEALATRMEPAPWAPEPRPIGQQFLACIQHLQQHKGQLFYYLKLQGKPVHTGTLWGLE